MEDLKNKKLGKIKEIDALFEDTMYDTYGSQGGGGASTAATNAGK